MASAKPDKMKKGPLRRVLVVEDDPVIGLSLESALLDGGAGEVVVCPSMAATLADLERARPDSIVLDVHLADRNDGWALAELVGLLGPKKPRIAFSTGSPEEIPEEVKELGPVFVKPYDPSELVEALLSNRRSGIFARIRDRLR